MLQALGNRPKGSFLRADIGAMRHSENGQSMLHSNFLTWDGTLLFLMEDVLLSSNKTEFVVGWNILQPRLPEDVITTMWDIQNPCLGTCFGKELSCKKKLNFMSSKSLSTRLLYLSLLKHCTRIILRHLQKENLQRSLISNRTDFHKLLWSH